MPFRLIPLLALGLVCLALAACPRQGDDGQAPPADQTQAAAQEKPQPREIVPQPNPVSTVSKLVDTMNAGDQAAFELLLHPDGPGREKLLGKFSEFDRNASTITIDDVSIRSEDNGVAEVIYDLKVEFNDPEIKPDYETGRFTLHFEGGSWLIWNVN